MHTTVSISCPSLGPNLFWTYKRLKHSSNYIDREREKKELTLFFLFIFLGGSEITDSGTIETEPIFANRTSDELDDIDQQNKPDKDVLFTAKTTFNYTAMVINGDSTLVCPVKFEYGWNL